MKRGITYTLITDLEETLSKDIGKNEFLLGRWCCIKCYNIFIHEVRLILEYQQVNHKNTKKSSSMYQQRHTCIRDIVYKSCPKVTF